MLCECVVSVLSPLASKSYGGSQIKLVHLDTKLVSTYKYSVCTKYILFQRIFYMGKRASVNIAS